ncbi:hypothetical protein DL96DRAFT_1621631 [Flagelloscypha sp. PMI_526]|nr:hypothetical protein DL96DRAFT_1621631 [Flagelloscypha sp. PMI_526]
MFSSKRPASPTPSYDSSDEVKGATSRGTFDEGPDTALPDLTSTSGSLVYECRPQSHSHDSGSKWKFSTLNARYSLQSSGETIYKTETAREHFAPKFTLIQRIKPYASADEFETIVTIHHKIIGSSVFEFANGDKIPSNVLMRKEKASSFKSYGFFGRDRIITLPDRREARWSLGSKTCLLVLNNDTRTPLATFHRNKATLLTKQKMPDLLEFFPTALSVNGSPSSGYEQGVLSDAEKRVVEFIFVTWLYVEKLRRDRDGEDGAGEGGDGDGGGE